MEPSYALSRKMPQELRDVHLRQWISKARSKLDVKPGAPSSSEIEASDYTKLAVKVALKIAECLFEEERRSNGEGVASLPLVPLECIDARFVVVQVACYDPLMEGPFGSSGEFSKEWDFEKEWNEGEEAKLTAEVTIPTNETAPQEEDDCDYEAVEQVKIVHNIHGSTDVGSKYFRLFHLGKIFYELFSGKKPRHRLRRNSTPSPVDKFDSNISQNQHFPGQQFYPPFQEHQQLKRPSLPSNIYKLNLGHDSSNVNIPPFERRKSSSSIPSKTFKRISSHSKRISLTDEDENLTKLELSNLPISISNLITNLMECKNGTSTFFNSFEDVYSDLQLMLVDPARFLDDIQIDAQMSLTMSDYLYGREEEISSIRNSYQRCRRGERCGGIVIIGTSGIGKSTLALQAQTLTSQANGYFLRGKFDQFQDIVPFSVIGSAFNGCCEMFLEESDEAQRKGVSEALSSALGDQAYAIRELVPSLGKIIDIPPRSPEYSFPCISSKKRIHLFCVFVQMVSSYLFRPITLFLDDLQWADPASLSLLQNLLVDAKGTRQLFFAGCARKEDIEDNHNFSKWLQTTCKDIPLQRINIDPLNVTPINKFVSDTLRLSPRLTRPLSEILYHKTLGIPRFLRHLIKSFKDEGLIFFSLSSRRWMWNQNKIKDKNATNDVAEILMSKMSELPSDIQTALKVTSCIGSKIDKNILGILSADVEMNLKVALEQAVKAGFMDDCGMSYRFVHDRIKCAAYNSIPSQQRNLDHLRFGLAICAYTLDHENNDEEFFMAMNQINRGGPSAVRVLDRSRKRMIAALNLKAGKRSLFLTNHTSALTFLKHGISFLEDDHWKSQYEISLELYDAATEAACALNNDKFVKFSSESIIQNATAFDDKLNAMYSKILCLTKVGMIKKAKEESYRLLAELGEEQALSISGVDIYQSVGKIKAMLEGMAEGFLLSMKQMKDKRLIIITKLYCNLYTILSPTEPNRVNSVCARVMQLTWRDGISPISPIVIAIFGALLISSGDPTQGCRLGQLALRLLEKLNDKEYSSQLLFVTYTSILWTSEPLQSLAESHLNGYNEGARIGDIFFSKLNYQNYMMLSFLSGQNLLTLKSKTEDFLNNISQREKSCWFHQSHFLHLQITMLINGPDSEIEHRIDSFPTREQIMINAEEEDYWDFSAIRKIHEMFRLILFRDVNTMVEKQSSYSLFANWQRGSMAIFVIGIFYEGLISFFLARQTKEEKWKINGEAALSSLNYWAGFSAWNFKNKVLLLEAEQNFLLGNHDKAGMAYDAAIKKAHECRFVHEEAIACELAGYYYCEMQDKSTFLSLFTRARKCYATWGSTAKVYQMDKLIGNSKDSPILTSSKNPNNFRVMRPRAA